ncbi:MAG: glycosyltransferase family 39 protein [Chloroflexi bacterium]|nr:glycosyltransferase family 39 protein [Chloroflexota bacterium]
MLHKWQQLREDWSQRTSILTLSGALLCLWMAFIAQRNLDQHQTKSLPLAMLGLAAFAFAMLLCHIALETSKGTQESKPSTIFLPAVATTLALSLLGCLDFGGNRFRPLGLVLWVSGLLFTLLYLWLISPDSVVGERPNWWRQRKQWWLPAHWLVIAAIVLVGAWFRLRLLSEIPAEMGFDLAEKYFDSLSVARGSYFIFFPARLGREGLFFYLVALVGRFMGMRELTLHITSALIGILTIVAVYHLGQEAFNRQVGLLAAFLLAINRWHIVLSRTGFRAVTMPFFTILALYTFIRALRLRRPLDFGWAGIALGTGVYSYRSFLFVPVALAIGFAWWVFATSWSDFRTLLPGLTVIALIAAVVAAPLARYVLENPDKYLARERYQLQAIEAQKERSQGLLAYFWCCMLGFNSMGDGDPRFNVPFARLMGFVSGALMVLGLTYALWRWRHGYNAFLLAAWFTLILPSALSMLPDEYPSSLRMSGAIGPAIILAALPLPLINKSIHQIKPTLPELKPLDSAWSISLTWSAGQKQRVWTWHWHWDAVARCILALAVVLLCAYETAEVHRFYFQDYIVHLPDMSNYSLTKAIADEIAHYHHLPSTYIKPWPNWFDSTVLQLHVGTDRSWDPFVKALVPDQPPLSMIEGTALFILHPADHTALATLQTFFPRTVTRLHHYPNGEPAFYVIYCER